MTSFDSDGRAAWVSSGGSREKISIYDIFTVSESNVAMFEAVALNEKKAEELRDSTDKIMQKLERVKPVNIEAS